VEKIILLSNKQLFNSIIGEKVIAGFNKNLEVNISLSVKMLDNYQKIKQELYLFNFRLKLVIKNLLVE
jgi:hypothetical protein